MHASAETLAFLLELGRRGTRRRLTARSVGFIHPMGDVHALEGYFGCRVRTGADRNRPTLNRDDLNRPFASHNEELLEILTPALERTLGERQSQLTVSAKIRGDRTIGCFRLQPDGLRLQRVPDPHGRRNGADHFEFRNEEVRTSFLMER